MKQVIHSDRAPKAIGPYSQAIKAGKTVYLSGQVGMDPKTMALVSSDFKQQAEQVFRNLLAVSEAAGGDCSSIVKLTIYLVDMLDYPLVNEVMELYWKSPFPARACFAVKALPKGAVIEVDAIMVLGE